MSHESIKREAQRIQGLISETRASISELHWPARDEEKINEIDQQLKRITAAARQIEDQCNSM